MKVQCSIKYWYGNIINNNNPAPIISGWYSNIVAGSSDDTACSYYCCKTKVKDEFSYLFFPNIFIDNTMQIVIMNSFGHNNCVMKIQYFDRSK